MSSPPARGSSRLSVSVYSHGRVVPARAGIFPGGTGGAAVKPRRPRPRGDLPYRKHPKRMLLASSPPARGSSRRARIRAGRRRVVPARAGIFPVCRGWVTRSPCRPRPRGDLPQRLPGEWQLTPSSPPARGSSRPRRRRLRSAHVVPARAGIFPVDCGCGGERYGRPRPRGDLPRDEGPPVLLETSSPPARGSSWHSPVHDSPAGVVPARAGIFLGRDVTVSPRQRRPRPRGDLPRASPAATRSRVSSPPARGSSASPAVSPAPLPVVPARAGIFRREPPEALTGGRRPRPRGDLPSRPGRCP